MVENPAGAIHLVTVEFESSFVEYKRIKKNLQNQYFSLIAKVPIDVILVRGASHPQLDCNKANHHKSNRSRGFPARPKPPQNERIDEGEVPV